MRGSISTLVEYYKGARLEYLKRPKSLSFFARVNEFSIDEKIFIIDLLTSLISIDEDVTYNELFRVTCFSLGLNLSMEATEKKIGAICKGASLDKNEFYLKATKIYSSFKNQMSGEAKENYPLVDHILNLEQEKVAEKFRSFPLELKLDILFYGLIAWDNYEISLYDEAMQLNDQAWNKMKNGAYEEALIDAKKSIDIVSASINNDTLALIYYHLKNFNEAIKYANISIALCESNAEHLVTRAKINAKMKKSDLALIDIAKAIVLDGENKEALGLIEKLLFREDPFDV